MGLRTEYIKKVMTMWCLVSLRFVQEEAGKVGVMLCGRVGQNAGKEEETNLIAPVQLDGRLERQSAEAVAAVTWRLL